MCSRIKIIIRGIISALLLRFNHIADAGEMVLCPTASEIVKNPVENMRLASRERNGETLSFPVEARLTRANKSPLNYSNSPEFPDNSKTHKKRGYFQNGNNLSELLVMREFSQQKTRIDESTRVYLSVFACRWNTRKPCLGGANMTQREN